MNKTALKTSGFRKKKEKLKGTKLYMSSQLVDAIYEMKQQDMKEKQQRQERRDKILQIQQQSVVDENSVGIQLLEEKAQNNPLQDLDYYSEEESQDGYCEGGAASEVDRMSTYRSENRWTTTRDDKSVFEKFSRAMLLSSNANKSFGQQTPRQMNGI